MFNTSELGSYVWKAFISSGMYVVISLIVTEIQQQEGPHQHRLQQLNWQVIHILHSHKSVLRWVLQHFLPAMNIRLYK